MCQERFNGRVAEGKVHTKACLGLFWQFLTFSLGIRCGIVHFILRTGGMMGYMSAQCGIFPCNGTTL